MFARKAPRHGDIWQVMLWSPTHPDTVSTLRHGAFLSNCQSHPAACEGRGPARGEVEALDRDGRLVTFLWAVEGPGVVGEEAWEIRVDDLADGGSSLAAAGFGHEACTGPPVGLEYVWPEAPVANGGSVLFSQLEGFNCFERFASVLGSYRPGSRRASAGALADVTLALASEGDVIYGLVPSPAQAGADSPSCSAVAPCMLERLTEPMLGLNRFVPEPPFE